MDNFDRKIVAALVEDGRMTVTEFGPSGRAFENALPDPAQALDRLRLIAGRFDYLLKVRTEDIRVIGSYSAK